MAMAGGCIGMGNVGGVTVNNVIGRGADKYADGCRTAATIATLYAPYLPRERLFQKSGNGVARTNVARVQHHCLIFESRT